MSRVEATSNHGNGGCVHSFRHIHSIYLLELERQRYTHRHKHAHSPYNKGVKGMNVLIYELL